MLTLWTLQQTWFEQSYMTWGNIGLTWILLISATFWPMTGWRVTTPYKTTYSTHPNLSPIVYSTTLHQMVVLNVGLNFLCRAVVFFLTRHLRRKRSPLNGSVRSLRAAARIRARKLSMSSRRDSTSQSQSHVATLPGPSGDSHFLGERMEVFYNGFSCCHFHTPLRMVRV